MTTKTQLTEWMNGYLRAWSSNDPAEIGALFTDDASYRTAPFDEPWRGRQEIIEGWIGIKDEPGGYEFEWHPVVTADGLAVIEGTTKYRGGKTYSNLWVLRLDDRGRCRDYTEWYMEQKE